MNSIQFGLAPLRNNPVGKVVCAVNTRTGQDATYSDWAVDQRNPKKPVAYLINSFTKEVVDSVSIRKDQSGQWVSDDLKVTGLQG